MKKRSKILSAYKEYNANSRDVDTGDCVKRAISFALGLDYDTVSKDLNVVKRKLNARVFNEDIVWETYLKDNGYDVRSYPNRSTTVAEFCEQYPQGTYILETGNAKHIQHGWGDHLCCVMDGDLYDSWDSTKQKITKWCMIDDGPASELTEFNEDGVTKEILDYLRPYIEKLSKKSKLENLRFVSVQDMGRFKSPYTLHFQIYGKIPKDIPRRYRPGVAYGHDIYAKLNPRLSEEQNIDNLKKKVKQRAYDWWYNVNKDISDIYESESMDVSPDYRGYRQDLLLVPSWARPLMLDIDVHENSNYGYKYEASMKSLPGDPRGGTVSFYADTLTEFKNEFKYYKDDYSRYGYEY